jgi:hypothetical protein
MQKQTQTKDHAILWQLDDEPDITSSLKEALRDNGVEQVDIANNPLLALNKSVQPASRPQNV